MAAHPDQGNRSIIFLNAHKLIFNPSLSLCVALIFNVWCQVEIFGGLDPCCQHATTTLAADFLFTAHRSDLWIMLLRTCIGTLGFDCMTPWSALALKLATMACAVIIFLPESQLENTYLTFCRLSVKISIHPCMAIVWVLTSTRDYNLRPHCGSIIRTHARTHAPTSPAAWRRRPRLAPSACPRRLRPTGPSSTPIRCKHGITSASHACIVVKD